MNKRGFTLIELIMVIIIIGIIGMITIPGIMEAYRDSQKETGEDIEKILKENLEMYNLDNEADLWCDKDDFLDDGEYNEEAYCDCIYSAGKGSSNMDSDGKCILRKVNETITSEDLYEKNPDIDMGDCLLKDGDSLSIEKDYSTGKYTYTALIACSKSFHGKNWVNEYASDSQFGSATTYYDTDNNKKESTS